MMNSAHRGTTHHLHNRRGYGIARQVDAMACGDLVTAHTHIRAQRPPAPRANAHLAEVGLGGTGYVDYPGRTMHVQHPAGVTVPAIRAGEVRWSANPIVTLNPVIADSAPDGVA